MVLDGVTFKPVVLETITVGVETTGRRGVARLSADFMVSVLC